MKDPDAAFPQAVAAPPGRQRVDDAVVAQFGANLRELRLRSGLTVDALAAASGPAGTSGGWVAQVEAGRWQVGVLRALCLAGALGVGIDDLTERIFWNPGEVAARPGDRRSDDERLAGFFSVVTTGPVFEEPTRRVAADHESVAAAVGRTVLDARRRRHLHQCDLRLGDTSAATLIERGHREPRLEGLVSIARALELPPACLLEGIDLGLPTTTQAPESKGSPSVRHLYDPVARLWLDDRTTAEIAEILSITPRSVEGIVRRMRVEGRHLPRRGPGGGPSSADDEEGEVVGAPPGETDHPDRAEVLSRVASSLRSIRREAGISARMLGEAAEVPGSTVHRAEGVGFDLPFSSLLRLASGLRVPASRLLAGVSWDPARLRFLLTGPGPSVTPSRPCPAGAVASRNLRRIRRAQGLSQEALAARIGIMRRSLSAIEIGDYTPRPITLLALAAGLEVAVAELLEGICDWYVRPLPDRGWSGEQPPHPKERWLEVARLWKAGHEAQEIAELLDMTRSGVASAVCDMRDGGVDLAYRRPPVDRGQLSARLRRLRAARGGAGARP